MIIIIDEIDGEETTHYELTQNMCQMMFPDVAHQVKRRAQNGRSVQFEFKSPYNGDCQKIYQVQVQQ